MNFFGISMDTSVSREERDRDGELYLFEFSEAIV